MNSLVIPDSGLYVTVKLGTTDVYQIKKSRGNPK